MPVVTGAGLVGRVVDVSKLRAIVRLVTDPNLDVGIRSPPTGDTGVARGNGPNRDLSVDLLEGGSVAKAGEVRGHQRAAAERVSARRSDRAGAEQGVSQKGPNARGSPCAPSSTSPSHLRQSSDLGRSGAVRDPGLAGIKVPFAMVLVLLLQSSLLGEMRLRVVRPDALVLLPIAAGIIGGSERGRGDWLLHRHARRPLPRRRRWASPR